LSAAGLAIKLKIDENKEHNLIEGFAIITK
jgi:hypothetical protein